MPDSAQIEPAAVALRPSKPADRVHHERLAADQHPTIEVPTIDRKHPLVDGKSVANCLVVVDAMIVVAVEEPLVVDQVVHQKSKVRQQFVQMLF